MDTPCPAAVSTKRCLETSAHYRQASTLPIRFALVRDESRQLIRGALVHMGNSGQDELRSVSKRIPTRYIRFVSAIQGSAYQVERPPPLRTSIPFVTKDANVALSVLGLAPASRTISRDVTRPWSRA